jgi:hypothetical protein
MGREGTIQVGEDNARWECGCLGRLRRHSVYVLDCARTVGEQWARGLFEITTFFLGDLSHVRRGESVEFESSDIRSPPGFVTQRRPRGGLKVIKGSAAAFLKPFRLVALGQERLPRRWRESDRCLGFGRSRIHR